MLKQKIVYCALCIVHFLLTLQKFADAYVNSQQSTDCSLSANNFQLSTLNFQL